MTDSKILSGSHDEFEKITEILKKTTLDSYLLEAGKRRTNDIYLIDAASNEQLKTRDFLQRSYSLAAELQRLGCTKNTIVGILSENRLEYAIVTLGTLMIGGIVTCLNPYHTVDELKLTYGITKPAIMFCSAENYEKLTQVAPTSTTIVVFDSNESLSASSCLSFSQLTQSTKIFTPAKNGPEDVALILYSSGTTGLSKGVMLTHKNVVFMLILARRKEMIMKQQEPNNMNREAIRVIAAPMFHSSGLMYMFNALPEQTVILLRKFELKLYLATIEKYRIQHVAVIPAFVVRLVKSSITDSYDLSSLRSAMCGAGALKPELEKAFKEKFHLEYIEQVYGLTECLMMTIKKQDNMKLGTCGSVLLGLQMKVVNPETGEILGSNEPGEICVRGPLVMKGYYQNEQATANTFDEDGWLRTGDIGYCDEDSDFFIIDRIKDMIKYKSSQVAPTELETLLETHPAVEDSVVIGIPDEDAGELPRAYVVKRVGAKVTEEEIIEFVAARISPRKRLHGGVEFVSEILRNASGKVLRTKLLNSWKATHRME